jgi:hypothetical protein
MLNRRDFCTAAEQKSEFTRPGGVVDFGLDTMPNATSHGG